MNCLTDQSNLLKPLRTGGLSFQTLKMIINTVMRSWSVRNPLLGGLTCHLSRSRPRPDVRHTGYPRTQINIIASNSFAPCTYAARVYYRSNTTGFCIMGNNTSDPNSVRAEVDVDQVERLSHTQGFDVDDFLEARSDNQFARSAEKFVRLLRMGSRGTSRFALQVPDVRRLQVPVPP